MDADVSVADSRHDGAACGARHRAAENHGSSHRAISAPTRTRPRRTAQPTRGHRRRVAIQRFGSRLNLHIHLHAVISDAVWIERDGALVIVELPPPTDDDVDTIVREISRRTTADTDRRTDDGTLSAPATDDAFDDARGLAQLVLSDTIAHKPSILDDFPTAAQSLRKLTARCDGFSLERKPCVAAAGLSAQGGCVVRHRALRYGGDSSKARQNQIVEGQAGQSRPPG
jgi:hypothetical protein